MAAFDFKQGHLMTGSLVSQLCRASHTFPKPSTVEPAVFPVDGQPKNTMISLLTGHAILKNRVVPSMTLHIIVLVISTKPLPIETVIITQSR